jgi:hypothetical protein
MNADSGPHREREVKPMARASGFEFLLEMPYRVYRWVARWMA